MKQTSLAAVILFLGVIVFANLVSPGSVQGDSSATPTPAASTGEMSDPLAWTKPPPPGPTQADHGAYTFWMRCMVCHGDQGQGLAKFRANYPKDDQNCTNHRCHAGPNSLAGFTFPDAPAIMGPDTLTGFVTADDLFKYISTRMPRQDPGVLSTEEYWNLTAYLIKQHGALPEGIDLNVGNARSVPVNPRSEQSQSGWLVAGASVVVLVIVGALWFWRDRRGRANK